MGKPPSKSRTEQDPETHEAATARKVAEVDLLREYRRVQLLLGRHPTADEMTTHSLYNASTYARRYGSWVAFRQMMGDARPKHPGLTRETLMANYREVKELLGRVPTGVELDRIGRYGKRTYHKHFGGHAALLQAAGDTALSREGDGGTTKDLVLRRPLRRGQQVRRSAGLEVAPAHLSTLQRAVVNHFLRLRKRLGRVPSPAEMHEVCASKDVTDAFGDYLALLECIKEHEVPPGKIR